jgi:hypothetical protein
VAKKMELIVDKVDIYIKGDEPGTWRTVKHVYDAVVKEFMAKKYGDTIETIANEGVPA